MVVIVGSGMGGGCGSFWPCVSEVLLDLGWGFEWGIKESCQCMEATVSLHLRSDI
jgi:hypothetical protein